MGLLHTIRTALQLAARVNEVEARCAAMELEWIDKKDALELLAKRLATRDARRRDDDGDLVRAPEAVDESRSPQRLDKAALRQFARERGMIR